mgnify:CR=1 FL=1
MKKQTLFLFLCGLCSWMNTATALEYNVLRHGVVGDGKTLNTDSLQAAIDNLHASGGGQLYFPAGRYLTGSLQLKSNVMLTWRRRRCCWEARVRMIIRVSARRRS